MRALLMKKPPKGLSKWGRRDWHQQQRNLRFARRIRSQERSSNRKLLALTVKEFERLRALPFNDRINAEVGTDAEDLARVVVHLRRSELTTVFKFLKRLRRAAALKRR
jgi:hypothetical protein